MRAILCSNCRAYCDESEITIVEYLLPEKGAFRQSFPWIDKLHIPLCYFCAVDPDAPIPFVVTETGIVESKKRGRGRHHAA